MRSGLLISGWRPARRLVRTALPALLLVCGGLTEAHAHLMVAQRGTINFKEKGAWFVVSVPVSALVGVDDDGDGRLALTELAAHNGAIESQVAAGLELHDDGGVRAIEGLLINPSPSHGAPDEPVEHVVAMGRFAPAPARGPLRFKTTLFGRGVSEQILTLKLTRGGDSDVVTLTPPAPERELFAVPACSLDGWGARWIWVPSCRPSASAP